jgi:hypothetical protein
MVTAILKKLPNTQQLICNTAHDHEQAVADQLIDSHVSSLSVHQSHKRPSGESWSIFLLCISTTALTTSVICCLCPSKSEAAALRQLAPKPQQLIPEYLATSALVLSSKVGNSHLEKGGALAQQLIQPCDYKVLETSFHSQAGEDKGRLQQ